MNPMMELLIMKLRSEAEEQYNSEEIKSKILKQIIEVQLKQYKENKKISSTDYQEALDILNRTSSIR